MVTDVLNVLPLLPVTTFVPRFRRHPLRRFYLSSLRATRAYRPLPRGLRFVSVILTIAFMGTVVPDFAFVPSAKATCTIPSNPSTESVHVTEFAYDADGRVVQVNLPEGVVNYEYEAASGRHTATCTANSRTEYGYDDLGRLETVTVRRRDGSDLSVPEVTTIQYTGVGSRDAVTLPNGVETDYRYDALNRLTNLTHRAGTQLLAAYDYSLHPTGRRLGAVETRREPDNTLSTTTINWGYDAMYRLTNEVSTSSLSYAQYSDTYTYDKVGNRVRKTTDNGSITYGYNANDQLTNEVSSVAGATKYGYDANGSLTNKTASATNFSFAYNLQNRLAGTTITNNSGTFVTSYLYNDQGIRVRATLGATTNLFLVDDRNPTGYAQVLEELATAGSQPLVSYTLGDDILGQSSGGTVSQLLSDGHGSTRQLSSSDASITAAYSYDAYGVSLGSVGSTSATRFLYSGEQFDIPLQQYYLRARYYDPSLGAFCRSDSVAGLTADPQSLHKYTYGQGDPIGTTDPSGYFSDATIIGQLSRQETETYLRQADMARVAPQRGLALLGIGKIQTVALAVAATALSLLEGDDVTFFPPPPPPDEPKSSLVHFSNLAATQSILTQNKLTANSEMKVYVADLLAGFDEPQFTRETLQLPPSNTAEYFVGLKLQVPMSFAVKPKVTKPTKLYGRTFVRLEYIHEGDIVGIPGTVEIFGLAPGVPFPNNWAGHLAYEEKLQAQ